MVSGLCSDDVDDDDFEAFIATSDDENKGESG
jgi:hypothetical protein